MVPTPFNIVPCNVLKGALAQYAANQTRNTGAIPFGQTHGPNVFTPHLKDEAIMVKCLAQVNTHYISRSKLGFIPKHKSIHKL